MPLYITCCSYQHLKHEGHFYYVGREWKIEMHLVFYLIQSFTLQKTKWEYVSADSVTVKTHVKARSPPSRSTDNHCSLVQHYAHIHCASFFFFCKHTVLLQHKASLLSALVCVLAHVFVCAFMCRSLLSLHRFIMKWMGPGQGLSSQAGLWLPGYSSRVRLALFAHQTG